MLRYIVDIESTTHIDGELSLEIACDDYLEVELPAIILKWLRKDYVSKGWDIGLITIRHPIKGQIYSKFYSEMERLLKVKG